jgi:hypothetical protein
VDINNLIKFFRTPQTAISFLITLVSLGGTVGLLSTDLTAALKAVLIAALGLIAVFTHSTASTALVRRAHAQALSRAPNIEAGATTD